MKKTDKKVKDYLVRAHDVHADREFDFLYIRLVASSDSMIARSKAIVEIAKMIQKEELK